jgi:hypothetical protein
MAPSHVRLFLNPVATFLNLCLVSTTSEQAIDISITNLQVSTTNQLVGQGGLFMGAGLGNIMLDSVAFDSRGVLRTDLDQVISVSTANSFRSLTLMYVPSPLIDVYNSRATLLIIFLQKLYRK